MEKTDMDKAFEWLITIIGILLAILNQYPEYFYNFTPNPDRPFSLRVAIGVVPTMVTLMMIWLIGKISSRSRVQALAKTIAWMFLIGATWVNLTFYFAGLMVGFGVPRQTVAQILAPSWLGFFLLSPIISYYAIIRKYRDVYPDVLFLKRKNQLFVLITVTHILSFGLMLATR